MYEYFCYDKRGGCGYEFETYQHIDDRAIPMNEPCPKCNKEETVCRKMSAASFVDPGVINADKNMERSGVQENLERIRDNHPKSGMKWNG